MYSSVCLVFYRNIGFPNLTETFHFFRKSWRDRVRGGGGGVEGSLQGIKPHKAPNCEDKNFKGALPKNTIYKLKNGLFNFIHPFFDVSAFRDTS